MGGDYQKWVAKLLGYSFDIQFKPGRANLVADALSRKTVGEVELGALLSIPEVKWEQLSTEIRADPFLKQVVTDLQDDPTRHEGFIMAGDRLLYKGRTVIPQSSSLKAMLLGEYHSSPTGGHAGEVKTYLRLAADWYWMGMRKEVTTFVQKCEVCQQHKFSQRSPAGLLQPLPIPSKVWDDISIDFIEGLPLSKGVDTILVVVDRLSKYSHFLGLKHPFTAMSVAEIFMKEIVRLHGIPSSIISDRDRVFLSSFWRELFKMQGTELKRSTAYHPQTDGQT